MTAAENAVREANAIRQLRSATEAMRLDGRMRIKKFPEEFDFFYEPSDALLSADQEYAEVAEKVLKKILRRHRLPLYDPELRPLGTYTHPIRSVRFYRGLSGISELLLEFTVPRNRQYDSGAFIEGVRFTIMGGFGYIKNLDVLNHIKAHMLFTDGADSGFHRAKEHWKEEPLIHRYLTDKEGRFSAFNKPVLRGQKLTMKAPEDDIPTDEDEDPIPDEIDDEGNAVGMDLDEEKGDDQ